MSKRTLPKRAEATALQLLRVGLKLVIFRASKMLQNLARFPSLAMPQDFSHQNLRGRSFKGLDLTGANFSHSNIRGANFTNAILRNAKFINAKAGLQRRWVVGLLIGSLLLAALSGFTSAFIGGLPGIGLTSGVNLPNGIFNSVPCLITLAVFCILTIRKGLAAALETMFWAMALMWTLYAAAALAVSIAVVVTAAGPSDAAQAWTFAGTVGRTVVVVGAAALVLAVIVILLAAAPLAVAQASTVAASKGRAVVALGATVGALFGVLPGLLFTGLTYDTEPLEPKPLDMMPTVLVMVGALAWTLAVAGLSAYVSWRFLAGDKKHGFVWKVAIALAAIGGTKFRGADLTDADFTEATLENTDFRGATLTGCCWFQSKRLFSTRF